MDANNFMCAIRFLYFLIKCPKTLTYIMKKNKTAIVNPADCRYYFYIFLIRFSIFFHIEFIVFQIYLHCEKILAQFYQKLQ